MKNTFLLIAFIVLTSCSSFQYYQFKSTISDSTPNSFRYADDTVSVLYEIFGRDGSCKISIRNKLNSLVIVHWDESALIFDGRPFPLWESTSSVQLEGDYYISGQIRESRPTSFLPPNTETHLTFSPRLSARLRDTVEHDSVIVDKFNSSKIYFYNPDYSPLSFNSYITLSIDKESFKKIIEDRFWIYSKSVTLNYPEGYKVNSSLEPFYTKSITEFGGFVGVVVGAGAVWLLVKAATSIEQ